MKKLKLNKAKLAFDMLEKEMSVITSIDELKSYLGGIQRNPDGSIKYTVTGTSTRSYEHSDGSISIVKFTAGYVTADDGTHVTAYRNDFSGNKNFDSNCNGAALADGEYWIDNTEAGVLMNQDFMTNPSANTGTSGSSGSSGSSGASGGDWNVGDIVVYMDSSGNILHTAKVVSSDASGTMVEGMSGGDASQLNKTDINDQYSTAYDFTVMRY